MGAPALGTQLNQGTCNLPDPSTIERARELRGEPTDAERALWKHLRRRQIDGHKFRRQQVIGTFIVDFVCLEKRLVVEVDGGQHGDKQASYDSQRSTWLGSEGYRVVRFWNGDVLREPEGVVEVIRRQLAEPPL